MGIRGSPRRPRASLRDVVRSVEPLIRKANRGTSARVVPWQNVHVGPAAIADVGDYLVQLWHFVDMPAFGKGGFQYAVFYAFLGFLWNPDRDFLFSLNLVKWLRLGAKKLEEPTSAKLSPLMTNPLLARCMTSWRPIKEYL